ncbi:O-antigen ligase family protein [Streptomyces sp. NBC_01465]|uniref:O-antigen ligase family protein n=1 Tax=Streptomyces sp. NBC_01465 TaxID=2903878 RepID=UPI002E336EB9|nr:O-antigen ligase family protein [Streptomyces sp. NBC_01465]
MTATNLLLAATALLALCALTGCVYRWPGSGIALFAAAQLQETGRTHSAALVDGPIGLMTTDVLTLVLLGATLLNWLRHRPRTHPALLALLALLALTAGSVLRGAAVFGVPHAGNEARTAFLQVLCAALFTATLPDPRAALRQLARVWVACAFALAALAVMWWAQAGIGASSGTVLIDGELQDARPMGAPEALLIGQAAVLLLYGTLGRRARPLAWPLLLVVVLMQHRTAWVATAAMLAVLLLTRRAGGLSRPLRLLYATVLASVCAGALALGSGGHVTSSLVASGEDAHTLDWRLSGWSALLGQARDGADWLLGLPFGSGYARLAGGVLITVSPHNYYLQLTLRIGLVGLAAFLLLYALLWRSAPRLSPDLARGLPLRALLCGQLVFCAADPSYPEQALLLGLFIACTRPERTSDPESCHVPQNRTDHRHHRPGRLVPR